MSAPSLRQLHNVMAIGLGSGISMTTFDFGTRGGRLWESLLSRDGELADEQNPNREVAISACHTADRVEDLETQCLDAEPVTKSRLGGDVINPLYIECRNQTLMLARLIAALRLPDAASGARPIHRPLRGVEAGGKGLSSLERARQRSAG